MRKPRRRLARTLAGLAMWCSFELPGLASAQSWPVVQPLHASFRVEETAASAVEALVRDVDGDALYRFSCRDAPGRGSRDGTDRGVLDCTLQDARRSDPHDLLVEAREVEDAEAFRRDRVSASELLGDCASYPEYGRLRHFRLRGMALTLSFEDVRIGARDADGAPTLAAYTLELSVDADPSAKPSNFIWVSTQPGVASAGEGVDEYVGRWVPATPGTYRYAFRISGDDGATWTYCDTNGSPFAASDAGVMTINQ